MVGLIDLVRKGYFRKEDVIVFVHTGGIPGLFASEQAAFFQSAEPNLGGAMHVGD